MATVVEENGLATREEKSTELQATHAAALARYEVEGALIVSKKFPRNEDKAYQSLIKSAKRASFAEDATYRFPRGNETIEGPSVYLAREAARLWGNIRYGCDVVSADETHIHLRGWAWDTETNARVSCDDHFAKLIYRKKGGWIKPDERDLRELQNRHAAFLIRNCILSLIPCDVVDDVVKEARKTRKCGAEANLDDYRKETLRVFGALGVEAEELEGYLGKKLSACDADDYVNLRGVYKSITDGNSKWSEYYTAEKNTAPTGPVTGEAFTKPKGSAVSTPTPKAEDKPAPKQETAPPHGLKLLDDVDAAATADDVRGLFDDIKQARDEGRISPDEAAGIFEHANERISALESQALAEGDQSENEHFTALRNRFLAAKSEAQRAEIWKEAVHAAGAKTITPAEYKALVDLNSATRKRTAAK